MIPKEASLSSISGYENAIRNFQQVLTIKGLLTVVDNKTNLAIIQAELSQNLLRDVCGMKLQRGSILPMWEPKTEPCLHSKNRRQQEFIIRDRNLNGI